MATQQEMEKLYDWLDRFQELRLGECADITCAFFNGDFGKTLAEAQRDKHTWVLEGLGIDRRGKVLDIGCGWGPMLRAVAKRNGTGIGLTLSRAQAGYCRDRGLRVEVRDWKETDSRELGEFDGVVCIGAFEHFCSEEEYAAGEQNAIYERFFDFCARVLPAGGRVYLQTMTWGGEVPPPERITLQAPPGSAMRILGRLRKFYPGSWLPLGKDQLVAAASNHFDMILDSNGRKDYIETLNRWGQATESLFRLPKLFSTMREVAALVPRYMTDPDFRVQIASLYHNDQQVCFQREIMSHERMFFEKR